jgi:hypothetical protein
MKTFQLEFADRLGAGDRFGRDLDPPVDQDLPVGGLRAQPRANVHHRAGRRIVEALLVADTAQSSVPGSDADAEAEFMAEPTPFFPVRTAILCRISTAMRTARIDGSRRSRNARCLCPGREHLGWK